MGKQQKQENNKVKADHERLKRALEEIREKRQFVLDTIKDSRFSTILKRYENDIDADKEALVGAEKKEIDGLQARVIARRALPPLRRSIRSPQERVPYSRQRKQRLQTPLQRVGRGFCEGP